MKMYAAAFLDELLCMAKEKECLCIADEVMTVLEGPGKILRSTGSYNNRNHLSFKRNNGGFMPLGVTVCSQKIFDAFYSDDASKTFFHGHSYTANPLACAAANASIELLLKDECAEQIKMITEQHTSFAESIKGNDFIRNIRQAGTIIAFDLNTGENTSYFQFNKKRSIPVLPV
jgi:adenosylmethionine-8-amino-7-oxononanoate aminotransferase